MTDGRVSTEARALIGRRDGSGGETTPASGGRFRFVFAAFLTIGAVSTVVQSAVILILAPDLAPGLGRWSTGGLVALGTAIYIGVTCRSWSDVRRRIIAPVVIAAILAAIVAAWTTTDATQASAPPRGVVEQPVLDDPVEDQESAAARQACAAGTPGYPACRGEVGAELVSAGWYSLQDPVGEWIYYSTGPLTTCEGVACRDVVVRSDGYSACPGGFNVSERFFDRRQPNWTLASYDLAVGSTVEFSVEIPEGDGPPFFPYEFTCR